MGNVGFRPFFRTGASAMGILSWVVLGLVAGYLAKFLMPGKDPGGIVITILLGIAGAVLGGWIGAQFLGWGTVGGFDPKSLILAVGGALLLLVGYRFLQKKR
jgi:uncharacterized membrane protein YeaQ/YmgE (transglycosylase-associated protein family)